MILLARQTAAVLNLRKGTLLWPQFCGSGKTLRHNIYGCYTDNLMLLWPQERSTLLIYGAAVEELTLTHYNKEAILLMIYPSLWLLNLSCVTATQFNCVCGSRICCVRLRRACMKWWFG